MRWLPIDRTDALGELTLRARDSLLGRSILRFVAMQGIDRCIVLSAQAFTALIPLFIVVASAAPAGQENAVSRAIINRFALSGESADAVEQLFVTPPGASSGVTVFSALLLLYSGVAFTRRLQRMYRAAWQQEKVAVRSTVFATLGLVALVVGFVATVGIRAAFSRLPLDWLWTLPVSVATGLVLWTSIPYLLLDRRVHWRRLLVSGGVSALAMTGFGIATPVYMPPLMTRYTNDYGLFGITITLIGWLLSASFLLVGAATIGAEVDASDSRWLVLLKDRFGLLDPSLERPVPVNRGLTRRDLEAVVQVLTNWLILAGAVWVATWLVPGINVRGGLPTYLVVSVLFGLVNAVLSPLAHWVVGFQSWLRVGGSALLVNGLLLAATAGLSGRLEVAGFGSAVVGALAISLVATLLELVVRPVLPGPQHQSDVAGRPR